MDKKDINLEDHVLVFPKTLLVETGYFQGMSFEVEKFTSRILKQNHCEFKIRSKIENDPEYKQLIPYVLFKYGDSIFSYRRGKLLSEKRLLGNYSIGIGGHISINDPNLFTATYEEGLRREIDEEVKISSNYNNRIVAMINDDSNDVGKVHFGIVHIFELESPGVEKREKSISDIKFMSFKELKENYEKFENWSKICIDNIDRIIKTPGY